MSCIVFLLDLIKNLPQLREGQGRKAAITDESKSTNFLLSKYLPKVLLKEMFIGGEHASLPFENIWWFPV